MSCCGSARASFRAQPSDGSLAGPSYWSSGPVDLEYSGQGQLTVTGPLTGTVYRFSANARRARVHGSDAPSLVTVPGLRLVR